MDSLWGLISQAAPEPGSWIDLLLGQAGLLVGLILAVWAFATRRVISRGTYDEIVEERDRWRDLAMKNSQVADKAVETAQESVVS